MFGAALWTLRQRRYAALAAAMVVIALVCIGAGSFELHRFQEKRHDNGLLTANAHAATVPLTTALVPLVRHGRVPGATAIRYRTVTASGRYVAGAQRFVADQSQSGRQGFWVLTPMRTAAGILLVVRGFVPATAASTRPAQVAPPPAGTVRVSGRLQTAQSGNDEQGRLGHGEVTSINPAEQRDRLGAPTYQAYLTLDAHQPGTSGVSVVPLPNLSNPSGGAGEGQLFSYIIQWYVFGLLALAVPFLFSRSEVREARRRFLGVDPDVAELGLPAGDGPRGLDAGPAAADRTDGALAVRGSGAVARSGEPATQRWERAVRLADRYGRSLGPDAASAAGGTAPAPRRAAPDPVRGPTVRSSAAVPHRSEDAYHGTYNDYLWELALADGAAPDAVPPSEPRDREPRAGLDDDPTPRPIGLGGAAGATGDDETR